MVSFQIEIIKIVKQIALKTIEKVFGIVTQKQTSTEHLNVAYPNKELFKKALQQNCRHHG